MGHDMGFRGSGVHLDAESAALVREEFWKVLASGLSPTAAATVVGVCGATGRKWAKAGGYQTNPKHCGIRYAQPVKEAFWAALRSGMSPAQAAAATGVSETSGRYWIQQAGYVPRTCVSAGHDEDGVVSRLMSFSDRCRLEELLESGFSQAAAAQLLGWHRSTISREVRRGATGSGYRARVGQDAADVGRARPKVRKLESNPALLAEVLEGLKQRYSPEQIAGRLRLDFPDDPEMWVSHETIYQALYVQPRGELARQVKAALRTGRTRRKPQGRQAQSGRGQIKDMINISERPAEADDRAIPGHWEGDLIIGKNQASQIGTLVERTTGFVMLLHLPDDRTAPTVAETMSTKIPEIPEVLRRSLTWDQGSEMAKHATITQATGLPIYFCDPHSPWQRGSNENTNGLLRQYFPKGTDLSLHSAAALDNVAAELNGRPRKRFGWRTPAEEFDRLLSDPSTFVATTT